MRMMKNVIIKIFSILAIHFSLIRWSNHELYLKVLLSFRMENVSNLKEVTHF